MDIYNVHCRLFNQMEYFGQMLPSCKLFGTDHDITIVVHIGNCNFVRQCN